MAERKNWWEWLPWKLVHEKLDRTITIAGPVSSSAMFTWEDIFGKEWTGVFSSVYDVYKRVPLVRQCINMIAHFTTRRGFDTHVEALTNKKDEQDMKLIKRHVDTINRRVNLDLALYIATIKREIWGRAGYEIVRDENKNIVMLLPLASTTLKPHIDKTTMQIDYYKYTDEQGDKQLDPQDVQYFVRDPLSYDKLGISAIEPLQTTVKLKANLEKDLLEAAKRLWAPIGLFQVDTSHVMGPDEKEKELRKFSDKLKPGQSVIYNKAVEGKVVDLKPDLTALVRAIEKADEEIIGNWGIPKALVSREKTLSKATLEFALRALYDSTIEGMQRHLKREIETQLYKYIIDDLNFTELYRIRHVWKPTSFHDPELVRAMAYAVAKGAMTRREMFTILGWDMLDEPTLTPPRAGRRGEGGWDYTIPDAIEEAVEYALQKEERLLPRKKEVEE